jgi:hypothetical protein
MHPQTVEIAAFACNVAAESSAVLFLWGIELATADADVVASGHRQRIHHVGLLGMALLEDLGQQIEEHLPERRVYGVQPAVEAALRDRLWYVAVLVQKRAARLDVAAEEGRGHQGDGHDFSGGEPDLGIVAMAHGPQKVLAQAVDGGYGVFQCVLPIQREGFKTPFGSGGY